MKNIVKKIETECDLYINDIEFFLGDSGDGILSFAGYRGLSNYYEINIKKRFKNIENSSYTIHEIYIRPNIFCRMRIDVHDNKYVYVDFRNQYTYMGNTTISREFFCEMKDIK